MKLHAITKDKVIFTTNKGNIITETLAQDAKDILNWYWRKMPANQN